MTMSKGQQGLQISLKNSWIIAATCVGLLSSVVQGFLLTGCTPARLQLREAPRNPSVLLRPVGLQLRPRQARVSVTPPLKMSGMVGGDNGEEDINPNEPLIGMPPPFFRSDNGTRDEEFGALSTFKGSKKAERYIQLVASLSPAETVGQFMSSAPPRVQSAMKETILSLFGSLGDTPAFESSVTTTKRALGSLFFQMEMTGYMFRNAEYRKSLERSISRALLEGGAATEAEDAVVEGNITLKVGEEEEVKVDAQSYVSELQREVEQLRAEMAAMKEREAERADGESVVAYLRELSAEELQSMTDRVSPDVVEAMRHLVAVLLRGIAGPDLPPLLTAALGAEAADLATELPSTVLAQLCMWQLVAGYNLREMEARDAFNDQLKPGPDAPPS